jgi:hypothetical protein
LQGAGSAAAIAAFLERNRHSLALFWDWEPASALRIKRLIERRVTEMDASVVNAGRRKSPSSPKRKKAGARVTNHSREEPTHEDAAPPEA